MNKNLIPDFDEIFGLDIAHFTLAKKEMVGYLLNSPLEQLVLSKFDYCPKATPNTTKPYKAH